MSILYHLTILPPPLPRAEALSQEIAALRQRFGGEVVYLNPNQTSPVYIPRLLFGFHRLKQIRALESRFRLHHLYNPDPFPFPVLGFLRRPVVYSLTGGITRRPNIPFFARLAAVTVMDGRSLSRLRGWGLENVFPVRPGIDVRRFTPAPPPPGPEIRLVAGSAPWTKGQFRAKGVDALLEAARQEPRLRLVFLWRGVLAEEMTRRVTAMGLQDRVTVLNRLVDVNRVLAEAHAAVVLASTPGIVKAYPHSLMESLAAGKPVLVSRAIPMADEVAEKGCGVVVEAVSAAGVLAAVESLGRRYEAYRQAALSLGREAFSLEKMLASFQQVYDHVFPQTQGAKS
ncbi:MAG: glycosyltransferase [Caldilineae bacterium]|nr:MAG: glycosyltransferase [Caldilineae bacterium]